MRHENIYRWIAQHLPKKLLYFCYIQVAAEATSGDYGHISPNDLKTWDAALKIFEEKHRIGHKYEKCWCRSLSETFESVVESETWEREFESLMPKTSGETMSYGQFCAVRDFIRREIGKAKGHTIVQSTDPETDPDAMKAFKDLIQRS